MLSQAQIEELTATVRRCVFRACGHWDEDLAQEAWVGILPMVASYDPDRNDSIGGFVTKRCFGAIVDRQRLQSGSRNKCQMRMVPLFDTCDTATCDGDEIDDRDELVRIMSALPQRQREALWAAFVHEEEQAAIAQRWGVTQSAVSLQLTEAKARLRRIGRR